MINSNEQQYLNLLQELVDKADKAPPRDDRTGVSTYSLFGKTLEFDLSDNKVPLLTTKKVSYKQILEETFWMYRLGNPDLSYMDENNNKIWRQWSVYNDKHPKGTIGRIYGAVLRDPECDQIKYVLDLLKASPRSRRAVFSAFDPKAVAKEELSFEDNVKEGRGVLNSCFTKGHDILLEGGIYKDISELSIGDKVFTQKGHYEEVINVFKRPFPKENLISLNINRTAKIFTTPEHPFYVLDKGWVKAENLVEGDYLQVSKVNTENKIPKISVTVSINQHKTQEVCINFTEDFTFILGYYLGNGHLSNSAKTRVCLAVPVKNLLKIEEKLQNLDYHYNILKSTSSDKQKVITMSNKVLSTFIREYLPGKAFDKYIPTFILELPENLLRSFLEGYLLADGYKNKNTYRITTVSSSLAQGVSRIAHKLGYVSAGAKKQFRPKTHSIQGREVNQRDTYSIEFSEDPCKTYYKQTEEGIFYKLKQIQNESPPNYDGFVYNITVDNEHTYTVNNIITHNCHGVMNQLYINDDNELEMYTYTRSNDVFLGCPYNIACYSTLAHLFARELNIRATKLIYQIGDAHLYSNHVEQAKLQLGRKPYNCPSIHIDKDLKFFDDWEDIKQINLINYQHHPFIRAEVAI